MLQLRAASLAETHTIASALASLSRAGDIIVLGGEMGAGKTAFSQGFGRALGIEEPITSPTFTLVHSYDLPSAQRGVRTLHHADLYRLDRTAEVADLAIGEMAEFGGIVLVEWGDVVEGVFGDHISVRLEQDVNWSAADDDADNDADDDDDDVLSLDGARLIEISGVGSTWAARWDRLRTNLEAFRC